MSDRTPTETLMEALSECETAESVLIIIEHSDSTLGYHSSTARLHQKLGMVEFTSTLIKNQIVQAGEVE